MQYGWHCLHVAPREGEEGVPFTYTIGLAETFNHPEIAIFGLKRETAHAILSDCVTEIRSGTRYATDTPLSGIVGGDVRVQFRRARSDRLYEYFGTATRHYRGGDFDVWIMFWPNMQGQFPWECADISLQAEALNVV